MNAATLVLWSVSLLHVASSSPEAVSLLGRDLTAPALPEATRRDFEAKLEAAKAELAAHPESAEAWIWVGRRTAYLGRFREAIEIFSQGLAKFPEDARFLRHRGHRWLTVRELEKAEEDLAQAARLVAGKPDEIEPDGLPNAAGIPTSTLQSNIHYHLGLARYLRGNFEGALAAYRDDLAGATAAGVAPNLDREVATRYWLWLTLRRLGRVDEAAQVAAPVTREWKLLENHAYHRLLLLFKGEESAEELLAEAAKDQGELDFPSISYGVGVFYRVNGNHQRAAEIFRTVVEKAGWAAFGSLAAEAELARL